MKIRYQFNTLPLLALLGTATAADAQVQPQLAKRYFEEATKLCERDAGRLWGMSLCGPMVIVDQASGTRATSQPEPAGPPPRFQGFVDGPVTWGGVRRFSVPLAFLPANDATTRPQLRAVRLRRRSRQRRRLLSEISKPRPDRATVCCSTRCRPDGAGRFAPRRTLATCSPPRRPGRRRRIWPRRQRATTGRRCG